MIWVDIDSCFFVKMDDKGRMLSLVGAQVDGETVYRAEEFFFPGGQYRGRSAHGVALAFSHRGVATAMPSDAFLNAGIVHVPSVEGGISDTEYIAIMFRAIAGLVDEARRRGLLLEPAEGSR